MTGASRLRVASQSPLVRVTLYYAVLVTAFVLVARFWPQIGVLFSGERFQEITTQPGLGPFGDTSTGPGLLSQSDLALTSSFSMLVALALMIPVAWTYVTTRKKKGYEQSIVQTLLILPIAIAGVVILVQDSIALAFALAGIVAGVRFRNTLEDTKDAVYVFVSIGVGLAAGVQALQVAIVTTIVFNGVALVLWYTDFGRAPPALDGLRARRRVGRAVQAKRSPTTTESNLIQEVDQQILRSMTPEQLHELLDKVQHKVGAQAEGKKASTVLKVHTTDAGACRSVVEQLLPNVTESWSPPIEVPDDGGGTVVQYRLRFKKGVADLQVTDELMAKGASHITKVEIER